MAKKRNKNITIGIVTIAIVATLIFLYISNIPLDKTIISSELVLSENIGFDLSPGVMNFGAMTPGSKSSREVAVSNDFDEPIIISIKSKGEISKNIIVSENNFRLEPQESRDLIFTAFTDGLTELRTYAGQIEIISKKA